MVAGVVVLLKHKLFLKRFGSPGGRLVEKQFAFESVLVAQGVVLLKNSCFYNVFGLANQTNPQGDGGNLQNGP